MNYIALVGRLTRDPEVRYSQGQNQTAIANISVAVDRRFKREGEPEADFFACISFGKQAEFIEKYFKKGSKIIIQGELQNNNYTNKDGQKVYSDRIVIHDVEFGESKASTGNNNAPAASQPKTDSDGFMKIPDNIDLGELPFA